LRLTPKQIVFVAEYLKDFNATRAARCAGYKGNDVTLASVGYENLRKPQIKALINKELKQKAMGPDEVLARLADHARGSAADFLDVDKYGFTSLNLGRMKSEGKLHLVKKYKTTRQGIEIELYDAQAALVHLGKGHGLWIDKDTADWRREIIELLRAEKITPEQVRAEVGDELATELFKSAGISSITD